MDWLILLTIGLPASGTSPDTELRTTRVTRFNCRSRFIPSGAAFITTVAIRDLQRRRVNDFRPPCNLSGMLQLVRYGSSELVAMRPVGIAQAVQLVWRDRRGDISDAVGLTGEFLGIRLAPDQHAVAVTMRDPQTSRPRLHVFEFARRVLTPIGSADVSSRGTAWAPDSQRLAFTSNAQGANDFYIARLAQPAAPELLLKVGAIDLSPEVWSQDDRVVYSAASPGWGLYVLSVSNPGQPARLSLANTQQFSARLSPSMRWLTATSEESGRREVTAQTFPDATTRVHVSANGGQNAEWREDGRELYFVNANRQMMVVDVDERAGRFGVPRVLFDAYAGDPSGNPIVYDVSPDGQRFLMVQPRQDAAAMTVVVNWPSLMRR